MKMKLIAASIALSASTMAIAEGAGIASSASGFVSALDTYHNAATVNPAFASKHSESDDFALSIGFGAIAYDPEDVATDLDDVTDQLDYLENLINNNIATDADVDLVTDSLAELSGKSISIEGGGNFSIGIPNRFADAVIFSKASVQLSATSIYVESDNQLLKDAAANGSVDLDDLESNVRSYALGVTETGVAFAKEFDSAMLGTATFGFTPKHVRIDLVDYVASAGSLDEDELRDQASNDSAITFDLGAYKKINDAWYGALALNNIAPVKAKSVSGEEYTLATTAIATVGYQNSWVQAAAEVDLVPRKGFGDISDTQYASIGVDLTPLSWLHLRAGYRASMEGDLPNVITAGLGIVPFDVLHINLAGFFGDDDTTGASLQLGLTF